MVKLVVQMVVTLAIIVGLFFLGSWLSRPRSVVVDGVRCVQSGFAQYTDIDCEWEK